MKVGRNDPCPCGSGRKYKHCCLDKERSAPSNSFAAPSGMPGDDFGVAGGGESAVLPREQAMQLMLSQAGFENSEELDESMQAYETFCEALSDDVVPPTFMEYLGRPNAATGTQKSLSEAAMGQTFKSREEVETFARDRINQENINPIDDFEGLSSAQMHRILTSDFDASSDLVTIADDPSEKVVLSAELGDVMKWLLSYYAAHNGEVKLTPSGNHNRALCRAYCERYPNWFGENRSIPLETSLLVLETAHDMVMYLGYTDEDSTRAWLAPEGIDVVTRKRWVAMFVEALRYAIDKYDWQEWIPEDAQAEHYLHVQKAATFLLYLLHKHPDGTIGDFVDRFFRAFPEFIGPAQGDPEHIEYLSDVVSELFFERFCILFGLIRLTDYPDENREMRDVQYRVSPLFSELLVWKV
jgi:hypothetical protein